jgi:hypothetical protein
MTERVTGLPPESSAFEEKVMVTIQAKRASDD